MIKTRLSPKKFILNEIYKGRFQKKDFRGVGGFEKVIFRKKNKKYLFNVSIYSL